MHRLRRERRPAPPPVAVSRPQGAAGGAPAASPARRVAVIGAGWAGLAAAWDLAAAGAEVTLHDRRPRVGGRAFSFTDPRSGRVLDNGQHVLLGCCDRFRDLLAQAGASECVRFQPLLRVPVRADGRWGTIGSARLPGPLHLGPSLAAYPHLNACERWQALRAARAMPGGGPEGTFAAWLAAHGQTPRHVARLWEPVGVAVLNCHADGASARLARQTLTRGFLAGPAAAALGFFTAPLGEVADRVAAALIRRGVHMRLGETVTDLQGLAADRVIAAVPPDALAAMHPVFAEAGRLGWSPILNAYLLYDRPVLAEDVAVLLGGDLPFLFNRGRLLGEGDLDGRLVGVSVSAADALDGLAPSRVVERLDAQIRQALPEAAGARLLEGVPVWQRHATFRPTPGCADLRWGAASPLPRVYLAGDWTDTGWPACLEGAVRSGQEAARLAFSR